MNGEKPVRVVRWVPPGWFYDPDPAFVARTDEMTREVEAAWDRTYATIFQPRGWGKSTPPAWTRTSVQRRWQATRDAVLASCSVELDTATLGPSDDLGRWVAAELERVYSRLMEAYADAVIGDVENFRPIGILNAPAVTEVETAEHWHVRTHLVPLVREAVRTDAVRVT